MFEEPKYLRDALTDVLFHLRFEDAHLALFYLGVAAAHRSRVRIDIGKHMAIYEVRDMIRDGRHEAAARAIYPVVELLNAQPVAA